jgi:hypothetical protein
MYHGSPFKAATLGYRFSSISLVKDKPKSLNGKF